MAGYTPWSADNLSNINNSEYNTSNNFGLTPNANAASLRDTSPSVNTSGAAQTGLSSTATNAISSGIGTAAQVATSVMSNNAQNNEMEKASSQDRQLSDVSTNDKLRQEKVSNSMRRKEQEIEQTNQALKQKSQAYDLRINRFLANIQEGMTQFNQARNAAASLQNQASNNPELRAKIAQSFGG